MTTSIFHQATTSDGHELAYRTNPLVTFVNGVHSWLYLPLFIRRWAYRRGVQRQIDGGSWVTIGGMP